MVNDPSSRRVRASQIKEQVRRWLESEGTDYLTDVDLSPYKRSTAQRPVDFVVTSPVPFAIEVEVPGDQQHRGSFLRHKARRLLRGRITLAERFGTFLPLVVVSPPEVDFDGRLPFVDAVFDVGNLPSVRDLPNLISLDPSTQEILRKGQPARVEFTEHEEALSLWSKSLTREDLLREEAFPPDTIAERTRRCARAQEANLQRERTAEAQSREQALPGMPTVPQPHPEEEGRATRRERAKAFGALRQCLDTELEATVVGDLGGEFAHSRVPLPGVERSSGAVPVRAWQAPDGRRTVIRTYSVAGSLALVKGQELFAEARMLRASTPVPEGGLLLLLSIEATDHIFGGRGVRAQRPIDPYLVNVLEEGGWKVFPWDFAEPEPEFVKYLRARRG